MQQGLRVGTALMKNLLEVSTVLNMHSLSVRMRASRNCHKMIESVNKYVYEQE